MQNKYSASLRAPTPHLWVEKCVMNIHGNQLSTVIASGAKQSKLKLRSSFLIFIHYVIVASQQKYGLLYLLRRLAMTTFVFFFLFLVSVNFGYAIKQGYQLEYNKPIIIKVFSESEQGVIRQESIPCSPQSCCFAERFICFMEDGKCICDLHHCNGWFGDSKNYWMEISGFLAERYCGRFRLMHSLTQLCRCDPNKEPPCGTCNPPMTPFNPNGMSTLPIDCRPY